MPFKPFEVTAPHVVYAALGGFVVLFGMFSLFIREKLYIGEACLAFVFGVIIGPYCAGIFDPRAWGGGSDESVNEITLEVTRVILAVGVFAIGVELPKAYMAHHWKSLFFLLGPVMTWGWFVSAGLIYALIPGLSFLSSLAIAACLTPTDPILAAAVVGGKYAVKHVPVHLRHLLAAESGCNDGAAFPFLYIALYLVTQASDKHAVQDWFLITWLYEVSLGIVLGALIGFAFRHLMKFCERKDLIDRQSYVAQYVSLAMFTIGVMTLLGSDDLLAAFSCGTAFAWDGFFNRQTEQAVFSSVIDLLFNITAFVYIGAWMPFNSFNNEELTLSVWRLIVIAILVLLLRRLPIMLALYRWIPDVKTFREAIFSGHFGPMGVGAVFISVLASHKLPHPEEPTEDQAELLAATIQPVVAFMVLTSITIHGLSIPFFSLGRRVHSVSRTWSRHQSMDRLGPEWASHTRRITRPEEIIINRDSDMERGDIVSSEKTGSKTPPSGGEEDVEKILHTPGTGATTPTEKKSASYRGDATALTSGRPDTPPDGTELVSEWQEGPDLVIEKRDALGDDVEVRVLHVNAPSEDNLLTSLRGPAEEVENTIRHPTERFMEGIHRRKEEIENGVGAMREGFREGVRALEEGSAEGLRKLTSSTSSTDKHKQGEGNGSRPGSSDSKECAVVDDEDEGWTSEASQAESSSHHARSKAGKGKHGAKSHPHSHSHSHSLTPHRRRNSMRRGVLARPLSAGSTHPAHVEDNERGRSTATSSSEPNSPTAGSNEGSFGNGRGVHRRVESLRTPPRSHSPAHSLRSIRFADGQGVSATPMSRPSSGAGRMDRESSNSEVARVTFDLPGQGI